MIVSSKKMTAAKIRRAGFPGFCLVALFLVMTFCAYPAALAQGASRSTQTSILRFREITGWNGTFSYRLDFSSNDSFGDVTFTAASGELSGQKNEQIEITGEVTFTGGSRGRFGCQGSAEYRVELFSLVNWGEKSILDTADGSGRATKSEIRTHRAPQY